MDLNEQKLKDIERRIEQMEKSLYGNGRKGVVQNTNEMRIEMRQLSNNVQKITTNAKWAVASVVIPMMGLIATIIITMS